MLIVSTAAGELSDAGLTYYSSGGGGGGSTNGADSHCKNEFPTQWTLPSLHS